ncbi:hypothetical protein BDZ91DRAFT_738990 [Kalaharituber pfeilii]|nr:hypothetical protein BDZ91DRAFT_738990 [Kalaharituber pfeilii]
MSNFFSLHSLFFHSIFLFPTCLPGSTERGKACYYKYRPISGHLLERHAGSHLNDVGSRNVIGYWELPFLESIAAGLVL